MIAEVGWAETHVITLTHTVRFLNSLVCTYVLHGWSCEVANREGGISTFEAIMISCTLPCTCAKCES